MVGAERRDVPDPNKAKKRFDGERPGEDFGSNGELDCDRSAGMKDRSTFLPWGAPMSGMEKTMRGLPGRI
jgi:hypothetical protein